MVKGGEACCKGVNYEGKTIGRTPMHFAIVVLNDSVSFGVTSGAKNAKNLLCYHGSDDCRGRPTVSTSVGVESSRAHVVARCIAHRLC